MSLFSELKRRNVLRVAAAYLAGAWLLVEVSETLFSIYGLPETAARIVVTLLAIGLPITLVLSWVYELTPEGLKLEKDLERAGPAPRTDTRRLDRAIIVLLALALGYFAIDKFVLEPGRVAELVEESAQQARSDALVQSFGEQSIAVLPFVNMSADPDQEYFSDGITEEMINVLVKIPGLAVPARTSVFAYKRREQDVREIGRELNVAHVLEGSVRSQGDQVRITAQLVNVDSGFHLWSETFDRQFVDIFSMQEEIAEAIAEALMGELGVEVVAVANRTDNMEAYDLYLQARTALRNRDDAAIELLERVTEADPDFAPAWAALAMAYNSVREDDKMAMQVARKALLLDADNVDALNAKGAALRSNLNWLEAERVLTRALSIDPGSAELLEDYAELLNYVGRCEEALQVTMRGLSIESDLRPLKQEYVQALLCTGKTEFARAFAERELRKTPDFATWRYLLPVWLQRDQDGEPFAIPPIPSLDDSATVPEDELDLWLLLAPRHLTAPDQVWIDHLRKFSERNLSDSGVRWSGMRAAVRMALIHAGQIDFVLESDMNAVGEGAPPEWAWIPMLAPLRQDERYPDYLEKTGLIDYWNATAWPGWCARKENGDISCQ